MSTPLPKDATLVELRPDVLTFRTREGLLPGTPVSLVMRLEGQPLAIEAPVEVCYVAEKERSSYVFHCRLDLRALPGPDLFIIGLFISKGRGSPVLSREVTLDLRGAVVAVTGASAGIGLECVLAFAREGSRLAAAARRLDRLEALAAEVRARGAEILVQRADVGEPDDVKRFVQATVERFGRLDVLVNNAGYGVRGTVEETPAAAHERLMRVNYLGTVYGCQAALPIMRRQGAGVIVNVSSIVGHRALPAGGAYAATKAAQISLTEALRVELRGSGVHACTVHPIGTETEFQEVAARESGKNDEAGGVGPQQSARTVAEAIVRCAKRPRPEVYPYPASRAIVWLAALAPGLCDWLAWRAARGARRL